MSSLEPALTSLPVTTLFQGSTVLPSPATDAFGLSLSFRLIQSYALHLGSWIQFHCMCWGFPHIKQFLDTSRLRAAQAEGSVLPYLPHTLYSSPKARPFLCFRKIHFHSLSKSFLCDLFSPRCFYNLNGF